MPVTLRPRATPAATPTNNTTSKKKRSRDEDNEEDDSTEQNNKAPSTSNPRKKTKQAHQPSPTPPVAGPSRSRRASTTAATQKAKATPVPAPKAASKAKASSSKAKGKQRQVVPASSSQQPELTPPPDDSQRTRLAEPTPSPSAAVLPSRKAPSAVTTTTLVDRSPGKRGNRRRLPPVDLSADDSIDTIADGMPPPTPAAKRSRKRLAEADDADHEAERLVSSPVKRVRRGQQAAVQPQAGPSTRRATAPIKREDSLETIAEPPVAHVAAKEEPVEPVIKVEATPPPDGSAARPIEIRDTRRTRPSTSRRRYNPLRQSDSNEAVWGGFQTPVQREDHDEIQTVRPQHSVTPPEDWDPYARVAEPGPSQPVRRGVDGLPERGDHMRDPKFMGSLLKPEMVKQRRIADEMLGTRPENRC